ncbi:MAG: hypothetical protein RJQ04_03000 [Longimicrobiales bacterium]
MSPFSLDRDSPSTLDLRTRRTEAEAMPPWKRRVYRGLLVLSLVGATVAGVAILLTAAVPSDLPFALGHDDGIVDPDPDSGLRNGDRILAVDGRALHDGDGFTSRYKDIARWAGRGPWSFTVADSAGGAPRHVEVEASTPGLGAVLFSLTFLAPSFLVAGVGLLALGARGGRPSVEPFVQLCLVACLPWTVIGLSHSLQLLAFPLTQAVADRPPPVALFFVAWPLAFVHTLISFLHRFPEPDPDLAETYPSPPVPRLVGVLVGLGLVYALGLAVAAYVRPDAAWVDPLVLQVLVSVPLVVFVPFWLYRASRNAVALVRQRRNAEGLDPDARQRTRLAVLGLRVGVLAFTGFLGLQLLGLLLGMAGGLADALRPGDPVHDFFVQEAGAVLGMVGAGLIFVALTGPFAGIGLAITRQGLWDVDLIASRATVVSLLGVGFVGLWAVADELLEAVVPGQFELAGPVLAGLAVAGLRAPLTRAVERRFFPDSAAFHEAVARASRALGRMSPTEADARATTAGVLHEELGASPVGVAGLSADGSVRCDWAAPGSGVPTDDQLRPALDAVQGQPVILRTDHGLFLGTPIDTAGGPTLVLLGPRSGGRMYDRDERRLLSVMLAPLGRVLSGR